MFDGTPGHEAFLISSQRTHTGIKTITDYQCFVVGKQIRHFIFVCLNLIKGIPDIDVFNIRAFQFLNRQRQPINKADNIGAAQLLTALQGELINGSKAIGR